MDAILILADKDAGTKEVAVKMWKERIAARAVLFHNNKVALMHVRKYQYYKLPGGGVENGESIQDGLFREVLEEVGCTINIVGEIGTIIEYRSQKEELQTSHCFLAQVVKKGRSQLTKEELDEDYVLLWVDLNEAIMLIKESKPTNYVGKFIVKRDLCFLEKAKSSN